MKGNTDIVQPGIIALKDCKPCIREPKTLRPPPNMHPAPSHVIPS
jgi:hypothetical protein